MTTYLENTTWTCGWCGTHSNMVPRDSGYCPAGQNRAASSGPVDMTTYWVVRCAACGADSVAKLVAPDNYMSREGTIPYPHSVFASHQVTDWAPKWVEGGEVEGAPNHIRASADEAFKCASIGAHMAAILMARTSLEAAAKHKGITRGNLVEKVKALAEAGHVRPRVADAADSIRRFGNDMAHGDIQVEVTSEDAAQVLALLRIVLQDIYQTDALLEAVGVSLEKRQAGGPA